MSPQNNSAKGTVFISYSKADVAWRKRVETFLEALENWADAEVWADDRIDAGEKWYSEIREAINRSAVSVLLLTADFLSTDFIAKEEIPELLRRQEELGMKLIPLLIHDCPWGFVRWLRDLAIVPDKATPLDTMSQQEQNTFLSRMTEEIAKFLETWQEPAEPATAEAAVTFRGVFEVFGRREVVGWGEVVGRSPDRPTVTATINISHLPETSATLFGRDAELDALDADWESPDTRVVAFVAEGGVGKSALINRWLHDLEADDWRGAERVFGWSFYSQGAHDQAATAEMFIDTALRFFGDPDPTQGSAWDRGERLAGLVAAHRTLLVLDGMEPLQSVHDFERGHLRDPGLQSLLKRLTRESKGICLISTREPVPELEGRDGFRAVDLSKISPQDSRALLRSLRVVGTDAELEALAAQFGPHALTVTLLGTWLYEQPGHATEAAVNLPPGPDPLARVLAGFETLLGEGPALDLLRVQGLFDRPAPIKQVAAALDVAELDSETIERLRDLRLLAPHRRHSPNVLEAHPLIREHYAEQLRTTGTPARHDEETDKSVRPTQSNTWLEGHRRLYEYLCETTEHRPDTLESLQPLYQAVAHGCQAGLHEQARADVYRDRILRGTGSDGNYSAVKLGAIGADLGAVACFFDCPWSRLSPNLSAPAQAWLLNEAAYFLRALGRLNEAVEPMRAGLEIDVEREGWTGAAISAGNLSELELTLGEVSAAIADGERIIDYTERSNEWGVHWFYRASYADALHQSGRRDEARRLFAEVESMQAEHQPAYARLYSVRGFRYCDLLLSGAERAAWRAMLEFTLQRAPGDALGSQDRPQAEDTLKRELQQACDHAVERASSELQRRRNLPTASLLDIALTHLTLGRAALYRAIIGKSENRNLKSEIDTAVDGLREAGTSDHLPRGLLTRAWQRQLTGDFSGAAADLDDAWEIAQRGPMRLYRADILLTRARLFGMRKSEFGMRNDTGGYPWGSPQDDLAEARRLIEGTGYHRRDEELADAEAAFSGE